MSAEQIEDVALSLEYVKQYRGSHSNLNANQGYLLEQCVVWQRLSEQLGWQCDNVRAAYSEISQDIQNEVYAGARAFVQANKGRYKCGGYIYTGEGQDLGQFWAELNVGNAKVKKTTANEIVTNGNAMYSIVGATFGIFLDQNCSNQIGTLTTNENGDTNEVEVTAGTVYIKELSAPKGYKLDTTVRSLKVEAGKTAVLNVSDVPKVTETLVDLFKIDMETGKATAQGNAALSGAEFTWHYYDGFYTKDNLPEKATRTWVTKTVAEKDSNGNIHYVTKLSDAYKVSGDAFYIQNEKSVLPLGTLTVEETKAPDGYLLDGAYMQAGDSTEQIKGMYLTQITEDGELAVLSGSNQYSVSDQVIRGGVKIQKRDLETKDTKAQGSATLKDTAFAIISLNENSVLVEGKLYKKNETVKTIQTGIDGVATTSADLLPYGKYKLEETKAPEGYSLDGVYIESVEGKTEGTYYLTKIIQDGNLAKIQGGNTYKIADRIFRGDIEFQKKDEETQESMAGIPFRITSVTTGESHMIMTDANGYFSSASNYVKHSENTNTGQAESGIWFGLNSGGEMSEVNDDNGAFPYDTYKMEELRCGQNVDKALYKGTFKISRDNYILDLGTIMNPDLVISTVAKDEETGTHYSNADESVTVIDTVTYTGLKKGKEYVMKGILMDHKTGEPVLDSKGKKIFGLQKFIPKTAKGSVEVEFNFDGNTLAGKNITVFEECYLDEELIAVHKDIEDVSQMIHFPELKTSVKDDQTGIHIIKSEKDMQITDTVEYHNLKKGKKYKITGILMDKDTGKAVKDANGEKITSSVEFVAEDTDGSVDVKFNFDGTNLGGKILVAFEKLYYGEKLYGTHADLEDEEQTMYVPEVETVALNKETETHHALADGTVELLDTVKYRNLLPGRNYTLHGMIVEKETGNSVSEERTLEFVPEKSEGSVELGFEISADELCGKTIVVYEEIKADGKSIAEHKDPEAKEQSIYFPEIGTKALDKNSKTQEGEAKEKQKIIDQITYKNLLPDETYVLKGVLMDKETGKELLDENGKRVTAGISFVPENEEGTIEMTFELDARRLAGKSVVVFERLYDEEEHLIAKEEDIENADQTVLYRKQEIPKNTIVEKPGHNSKEVRKSPKTGDENRMDLWLVMLCVCGIAVVTEIVIYKRRNR